MCGHEATAGKPNVRQAVAGVVNVDRLAGSVQLRQRAGQYDPEVARRRIARATVLYYIVDIVAGQTLAGAVVDEALRRRVETIEATAPSRDPQHAGSVFVHLV